MGEKCVISVQKSQYEKVANLVKSKIFQIHLFFAGLVEKVKYNGPSMVTMVRMWPLMK